MARFIPVDLDEFKGLPEATRGRVCYPLIKEFLESGLWIARLDREGINRSVSSLSASLSMYCRSHKAPVKTFQRKGEIYMMRLDIDAEGNPIPNWDGPADKEEEQEAEPITPETIAKKFGSQSG